jgi:hypothetical protein
VVRQLVHNGGKARHLILKKKQYFEGHFHDLVSSPLANLPCCFARNCVLQWWTHLWLNEGFARFMEHCAVDELFPEWDIWTQFCDSVYTLALALDSSPNSHPVEKLVNHPNEVNEIFDTISYAKGTSLHAAPSFVLALALFKVLGSPP